MTDHVIGQGVAAYLSAWLPAYGERPITTARPVIRK
jgi:hypothetical protein